eukprot:17917-Heterococcus_DN1.PRE.3
MRTLEAGRQQQLQQQQQQLLLHQQQLKLEPHSSLHGGAVPLLGRRSSLTEACIPASWLVGSRSGSSSAGLHSLADVASAGADQNWNCYSGSATGISRSASDSAAAAAAAAAHAAAGSNWTGAAAAAVQAGRGGDQNWDSYRGPGTTAAATASPAASAPAVTPADGGHGVEHLDQLLCGDGAFDALDALDSLFDPMDPALPSMLHSSFMWGGGAKE